MTHELRNPSTQYRGRRLPDGCVIERRCGQRWQRLSPLPSLKLRNHSPTGFEWGYGGSGPSQTALALLLDYWQDRERALKHYMDFKFSTIGGLPDEWELSGSQIEEAVCRSNAKLLSELQKQAAEAALAILGEREHRKKTALEQTPR